MLLSSCNNLFLLEVRHIAIGRQTVVRRWPRPPQGNKARLINHSCAPNCVTRLVPDRQAPAPRIAISTLVKIPKGQELFYDYKVRPRWALASLVLQRQLLTWHGDVISREGTHFCSNDNVVSPE